MDHGPELEELEDPGEPLGRLPPRLEGEKIGLFATRTPHRPNPIGLSAVKIENAELKIFDVLGNEVRIISGINNAEVKIERKNLNAGVYFYKLIQNGEIVADGKILAE